MSRPSRAVIKIGGSILTDLPAYRRAAEFIANHVPAVLQERLIVVVSAQAGFTDDAQHLATRIAQRPDPAALDLLWSTGELRSVALLALHLQALGVQAAALNVHETGLLLPEGKRDSKSIGLDAFWLDRALALRSVAIVPGFLARRPSQSIVSLGRGGSDLTAVLLAVMCGACRCELIKDVAGYFSADPHRDTRARHLPTLSFAEALRMADEGCDLVQRQAIEAAARHGLPLVIRSLDETAAKSCVGAAPIESCRKGDWRRAEVQFEMVKESGPQAGEQN